ncbi:NAD-dependent epimerase/dehydratase family protein [Streptomyces sp. CG1]|uniref:NAD-dependent epimerase/dehydratase family protein n=1 Tax=Streptomyces sp. CG1 TaxID=1287523 RepID=UPI0034E2C7CE
MTDTVLLTGATGFIGSAALAALTGVRPGVRVRALVRRVPEGGAGSGSVEWVIGDLTDPGSLRGLCAGADALVHLASYIGRDEERCEAVNVAGTRALMAEATHAGVRRVVHLSTAAVYGEGPHHGGTVDETPVAPVSAASRTRLAGEQYARRAGAVVLRPGLVLGAGDRWVVPALRELVERVPATWACDRGLLSVVDVGDLGRLIASVTVGGDASGGGAVPAGTYHASHPEPVRIGDLLAELTALGVLPARTDADWPWPVCLERLRTTPGRVTERQFSLLARDHWYRSEDIWRLSACPPGPGPLHRLRDAAAWHRDHLRQRDAA